MKAALGVSDRINEGRARRGLRPRPVRAVVVGFPNVGKSALINRCARAGARPAQRTRPTARARRDPRPPGPALHAAGPGAAASTTPGRASPAAGLRRRARARAGCWAGGCARARPSRASRACSSGCASAASWTCWTRPVRARANPNPDSVCQAQARMRGGGPALRSPLWRASAQDVHARLPAWPAP